MSLAKHLVLISICLMFLSSTVKAGVVEVSSAKAVIEGARTMSYVFTLKYRGNAKMKNRLIEGRYLLIKNIGEAFMDADTFIDDKLESLVSFKDEYITPVICRKTSVECKIEDEENEKEEKVVVKEITLHYWDVIKHPKFTFRRTFNVNDTCLRKDKKNIFRSELINGKSNWIGRLHRTEGLKKKYSTDMKDEQPIAGLIILDVLYSIGRLGVALCKLAGTSTTGLDFYEPDFHSAVDFYFIVDMVLEDNLCLQYRTVFETKPISIPSNLQTVNVSEGTSVYQENGIQTQSGFNNLQENSEPDFNDIMR